MQDAARHRSSLQADSRVRPCLASSPSAASGKAPLARARGSAAAAQRPIVRRNIGGEHLWERSLVALAPSLQGTRLHELCGRELHCICNAGPMPSIFCGVCNRRGPRAASVAQGNLLDAEKLASEVTDTPRAYPSTRARSVARTLWAYRRSSRTAACLARHASRLRRTVVRADVFGGLLPTAAHEFIRKALSESGVEVSEMLVRALTARIRARIEAGSSRVQPRLQPSSIAMPHCGAASGSMAYGAGLRQGCGLGRVMTLYTQPTAPHLRWCPRHTVQCKRASCSAALANALTTAYAGYPALQASVATALRERDANAEAALTQRTRPPIATRRAGLGRRGNGRRATAACPCAGSAAGRGCR